LGPLRRQKWLFAWGLIALAMQLAWATGHVHPAAGLHAAIHGAVAASPGASAEVAPDEDGDDHHHHAAHPPCAICWVQALATALVVPALPAIPLHRSLRQHALACLTCSAPAFTIPHVFQARAPPSI